jgi:hypothetical protein
MFTEVDIKALLRATPSAPPFVELLSGTGIVTESTLRTEISNRILDSPNSPGRTSVFELAKEFLVEARAVERLLPAQQEGWARIGASTIITAYIASLHSPCRWDSQLLTDRTWWAPQT